LTLLVKPLNLNGIHMGVLCLGLILLFFGYLYRKDPPQGAYIEKMMFLLLVLVSLEIFHNWSLMKIVEWESSLRIIEIGEFLSAAVLLVIALFFILRLRQCTESFTKTKSLKAR
jgi:putative effector of murein hydrolase